jgi:manganese/zinc/iron transport system permease protein
MFGYDLGPKAMWFVGAALVANLLFIVLFYKELKLSTFDAALASALGFAPAVLHYTLMTLVSVTAVAAFDAVGSILVVALMIAPAATAYLFVDDLKWMLIAAVGIAIGGSWLGCRLAEALDSNYAGAIASTLGLLFAVGFFFAPERGLIAQMRRRRRQKRDFEVAMLIVHLAHHEGTEAAEVECRLSSLPQHLRWPPAAIERVVARARRRGWVELYGERLALTDEGRRRARETVNPAPQ